MNATELTIEPREKDLGGFPVRRILPYAKRRMVGPFIFLDHLGPAEFSVDHGIDVRPHPHIGLATVTYLFQGELFHRDTLGSAQDILPGAVNWMTAGRGIAHSEHTSAAERALPHRAHGLQSWIALPKEHEENALEFYHHPASTIPEFMVAKTKLRLIAGSALDHASPVKTYSALFYIETTMPAGESFTLPADYAERALYLVEGRLKIGRSVIEPFTTPVFARDETIVIEALEPSRFMILGGEPFPEQRFIWWNFVSTSQERIEQAKADWSAGRFGSITGEETDIIPLPQ